MLNKMAYLILLKVGMLNKESESHSVVSSALWPHGLYSPWNSPEQNTGVGNRFLLQGIFPNQGSNPMLVSAKARLGFQDWWTPWSTSWPNTTSLTSSRAWPPMGTQGCGWVFIEYLSESNTSLYLFLCWWASPIAIYGAQGSLYAGSYPLSHGS